MYRKLHDRWKLWYAVHCNRVSSLSETDVLSPYTTKVEMADVFTYVRRGGARNTVVHGEEICVYEVDSV